MVSMYVGGHGSPRVLVAALWVYDVCSVEGFAGFLSSKLGRRCAKLVWNRDDNLLWCYSMLAEAGYRHSLENSVWVDCCRCFELFEGVLFGLWIGRHWFDWAQDATAMMEKARKARRVAAGESEKM